MRSLWPLNNVRSALVKLVLQYQTYPGATFPQEIPFVHHQHVEHDLQHAQPEYFRGRLHLCEEKLEGVESHPLGFLVQYRVSVAIGQRTYACDQTIEPETNEPLFTEHELFTFDGWHDQFTQYTFQRRILLKGLSTSCMSGHFDAGDVDVPHSHAPAYRYRETGTGCQARPPVIVLQG